jgi:hypothetical protein
MAKIVYLYGMRLRGFSPGAQPMDGFIDAQEDIMGEYHNVIAYNRPLKQSEMRQYDLDYIGARRKP